MWHAHMNEQFKEFHSWFWQRCEICPSHLLTSNWPLFNIVHIRLCLYFLHHSPMYLLHAPYDLFFCCLVPRPFPSKTRVWQVATNLKNESLVVYGLRCGWGDSKMWENILQLSSLQPGGACLGYRLGLRSRGKATAHDATLAYCILYVQSVSVHRSYVP